MMEKWRWKWRSRIDFVFLCVMRKTPFSVVIFLVAVLLRALDDPLPILL